MRWIAEYLMRGPRQSLLVLVPAALVPFPALMFWLSGGGSALLVLRQGPQQTLPVLLVVFAAAVVGAAWLGVLSWAAILPGIWLLAMLLRRQASWLQVVLASVPLAVLYAWVIHGLDGEALQADASEIEKMFKAMFAQPDGQALPADLQVQMQALLIPVLLGVQAALLQVASLAALCVGRWWQALLYNPGGFGREFQQLRLPPMAALALLLGMVLLPGLGAAMLVPILGVPLVLAGIALVHGWLVSKGAGGFWLIGLYVLVLLLPHLLGPILGLLAVVDSFVDFRGRAHKGS